MPNDSGPDMTNLWMSQPVAKVNIPLRELTCTARKFQKRILLRNVREYAGCVIVIGTFAYLGWEAPDLIIRAGCALIIAGTLLVAYTLHKRGAARSTPADMGQQTCLEFQRAELIRQRDLLQSVFTWYLLPFVPGLAVFLWGVYQQTMKQPNAAQHAGFVAAVFGLSAVVCGLLFIGIAKLNSWAAHKIQREIDVLDAAALTLPSPSPASVSPPGSE